MVLLCEADAFHASELDPLSKDLNCDLTEAQVHCWILVTLHDQSACLVVSRVEHVTDETCTRE